MNTLGWRTEALGQAGQDPHGREGTDLTQRVPAQLSAPPGLPSWPSPACAGLGENCGPIRPPFIPVHGYSVRSAQNPRKQGMPTATLYSTDFWPVFNLLGHLSEHHTAVTAGTEEEDWTQKPRV